MGQAPWVGGPVVSWEGGGWCVACSTTFATRDRHTNVLWILHDAFTPRDFLFVSLRLRKNGTGPALPGACIWLGRGWFIGLFCHLYYNILQISVRTGGSHSLHKTVQRMTDKVFLDRGP